MSNQKPTAEQLRKFWEWCGLKVNLIKGSFAVKEHCEIISSYGDVIWDGFSLINSLTLDNLFKYAVPKAVEKIMAEFPMGKDEAEHYLLHTWSSIRRQGFSWEHALFWAI